MEILTDEQLNQYRIDGTKVRVVRDALEMNDVIGIVVAWDASDVMIRRPNKRIVKVSRSYSILPFTVERVNPFE